MKPLWKPGLLVWNFALCSDDRGIDCEYCVD